MAKTENGAYLRRPWPCRRIETCVATPVVLSATRENGNGILEVRLIFLRGGGGGHNEVGRLASPVSVLAESIATTRIARIKQVRLASSRHLADGKSGLRGHLCAERRGVAPPL